MLGSLRERAETCALTLPVFANRGVSGQGREARGNGQEKDRRIANPYR
jgi:hypothetical protein